MEVLFNSRIHLRDIVNSLVLDIYGFFNVVFDCL